MISEGKQRTAVWLTPKTLSRIDGMLEAAGCDNRSQFLEKAARLYLNQLGKNDASVFLDQVMGMQLRRTAADWLEELCKQLFRWCVELNMTCHTIAAHFRDDEFDLWDLRRIAADEVRNTDGAVSFDRAAEAESRFQERREKRVDFR